MENNKKYSVGFSEFRNLMDLWDNYVLKESTENEIEKFLTNKQILMFFKYPVDKNGNLNKNDKNFIKPKLYGATEENRLSFAKIKHPNPEDLEPAIETFSGIDLKALMDGGEGEDDDFEKIKIFNKKDMKKIKVISQEKAVNILSNSKLKKVISPMPPDDKPKRIIHDE
jgi:hypothetical protein